MDGLNGDRPQIYAGNGAGRDGEQRQIWDKMLLLCMDVVGCR